MTVILKALPQEAIVSSAPVPPLFGRGSAFRFGFIVTNQAVYLPSRRPGFHLAEALEAQRIPLTDITLVTLRPAHAITGVLVLHITGLVLFSLIGVASYRAGYNPWSAFWLPAALLLPTVRLLLASPGRLQLALHTSGGTLEHTPAPDAFPLLGSRRRARAAQRAFVRACQQAGVAVKDDTVPSGSVRESAAP